MSAAVYSEDSEFNDSTERVIECIANIASRDFSDSCSVTVVIPALREGTTGFHLNVQQPDRDTDLLLAELQVLHTLPLSVVRPSEVRNETSGVQWHRKETNYIVIVKHPDGCEVAEILATLTYYINSLASLPTWNSRALFVVAVVTKDCGSDAEKLAHRILEELWKWSIVKVTVVIPTSEHYHVQAVSGKYQGSASSSHIFAFCRHNQPHSCTNSRYLLQIQQCPISPQLLNHGSAFVPKFPSNLEGCPIAVSTFVYEPFVFRPDIITNGKNSSVIYYKDGLEIKLLHVISRAINSSLVFLPPPSALQLWGKSYQNGTWTGIKGNVVHGRADVCVAAVVLAADTSAVMDPTVTYFKGGYVWVVPYPASFPRWLCVFRVFTAFAWLEIVATVLFVSVVMFWLSRGPTNQMDAPRTVSANICDTCAVLLGISLPQIPKSLYIRIFFIFWVAYSLAVSTIYQAFLTSFLTEPGFLTPVKNLDELLDSGIEYSYVPIIRRFLDSSDIKHKEIMKSKEDCLNTTACLERVAITRDLALCVARNVMDYTVFDRFHDADGMPLVYPFDHDFLQYNVVMYPKKGSPLLDAFNQVIVHVMQAGLLDKWYNDDIYKAKMRARKNSKTDKDDGYSVFSTTHLQGAFVLYGIGNVLGLLLLLLETAYRYLIEPTFLFTTATARKLH